MFEVPESGMTHITFKVITSKVTFSIKFCDTFVTKIMLAIHQTTAVHATTKTDMR